MSLLKKLRTDVCSKTLPVIANLDPHVRIHHVLSLGVGTVSALAPTATATSGTTTPRLTTPRLLTSPLITNSVPAFLGVAAAPLPFLVTTIPSTLRAR